jgi:hypothetical protein
MTGVAGMFPDDDRPALLTSEFDIFGEIMIVAAKPLRANGL